DLSSTGTRSPAMPATSSWPMWGRRRRNDTGDPKRGHYNGRRRTRASVENASIASVLGEIADLLEIKGENPFRIRAYRNAAQAVRDTAVRLSDLDEAELRAIPGVGKDIAARIRELLLTGRSSFHAELSAALPIGLLDILNLQGVGPKTVAQLHDTLHISSLEELEQAARAGALSGIKGMG